ncbi:ABC transporter permease [Helicobacter pametensis]|uniref:ABC transporter permease n=1 Tax=Helicobacter pametensis TaxID=95149 RepID=UPI0004855BE8|nr:ABC transporter permease [Helicobacter pametensis]
MIWNAIVIAFRQIFRNFLRSFLTTLGVIIGVASVVAMVNFGQATTQRITQGIASLGSNLLIVFPSRALDSRGISVGRLKFSENEVNLLRQRLEGKIYSLATFSNTSALIRYEGKNIMSSIAGVGEEYLRTTNSQILYGRGFDPKEFHQISKVCIIGNSVKKGLYADQNPLGSYFKIGSFVCEVVGVLKEKGQGAMGQDQDDIVLVPFKTYSSLVKSDASLHNIGRIYIALQDGMDSEEMSKEVLKILREIRGVAPNQKSPFEVMDTKEILQMIGSTTKTMTIFITAIAGISLLVGGIGIMNMMLVSVSERTREIGIRIAVGATGGEVLLQFLIEAIVLSVFGGGIGVCVSVGASYALSDHFGMPFVFDISVAFWALVFCVVIGIVFGFLPARRASRLNPIDALRYE